MRLTVIFVIACCVHMCICAPLIKVFCSGAPVYRGRVDSIVSPGVVSGHVHKVAGGSNFGPALSSQTPQQVYNDMVASSCTTCSIKTVDNSAYWHPDLYYQYDNGSLALVPKGGLTVYYLARAGSGAQANPDWRAFPEGFRMVSGDPFRRSFDSNNVAHRAINFACLSDPGGPELNDLSATKTRFCKNGLRLQVHFPQCWDGLRVDTPNHKDHVAFPIERPDGGNCPSTHPVRIPNLFFEAFYSVDKFPHGDGKQRFVLAPGDATGYGFHGDFLNGWNVNVLQQVLKDASCDASSTNNGNNVKACIPVRDFVQETPEGACSVTKKIPLTENIGIASLIPTLAGCNAITSYGSAAPICSSPTSSTYKAPVTTRFHLKSELNGKYWSCPAIKANPLTASVSDVNTLTYYEVFVATKYTGNLVSLNNEGPTNQFVAASGNGGQLGCDRGSVSDWEAYEFIDQPNGKVAIKANRNGKYITTQSDGRLVPDSTTVGTAQLFTRVIPGGGSVF